MGPAGELVERSTPWADLMGKDFTRLAELEGSPRCVADLAVNPLRYFLEGELRSEVAVHGEMSDVDAALPPADKKRILEDMEAYLKLTQDELLRGILYWVVKENYAKDDGPRTARISYSLSGQQMAVSLGRDLEVVLLRMGATEKFGPPPWGALERVLEGHLRSVQGRCQ